MPTVFPDLDRLPSAAPTPLVQVGHFGEGGDNRLVHGDNLGVLAGLPERTVQAVYIDPPYNTGTDFQHYTDARSRRDWLAFMAERLVVIRRLLHPSGSLFVQVDDNEVDYLKVLLDDIFGADALVSRITVRARAPSAFSTVNRGVFKASEYLLWVARDRSQLQWFPQRVPRAPDPAYTRWIDNPDDPPEQWRLASVRDRYKARSGVKSVRRDDPAYQRFILDHSRQVFRFTAISDKKAGAATVALKRRSREEPQRVFVLDRGPELEPVIVCNGQQITTYDRNVTTLDGVRTASTPLTNIWTDLRWEGIASEGGVRFKQGKKPERLIRRVLQLSTRPGDHVLDCFGGSGTTAAVAHKMKRRWTLIEKGPQALTHARPRLQRVVDGQDASGVSVLEDWTGGGGFSVCVPREAP